MKLSPIQLDGYALVELSYRANDAHKPGQPVVFVESDIEATTACQPNPDKPDSRIVTLKLRFQPRAEANTPYYVSLQLVGVLGVSPNLKSDDLETLLKVNGASLLYGVAREIVRQVTSIGPSAPLLIPSVSFRPEARETPAAPTVPAAPATK